MKQDAEMSLQFTCAASTTCALDEQGLFPVEEVISYQAAEFHTLSTNGPEQIMSEFLLSNLTISHDTFLKFVYLTPTESFSILLR